MHIYTESKFISRDFIQKINFFKTKFSDCFVDCKSLDEKQALCVEINNSMSLEEPFILTPNNVKKNDAKRNFYKLCSNALFGKFQQKNNHNKIMYASTAKEIEDIYFSDSKIQNIFSLNDQLCQIEIEPNQLKLPPNLNTNCYLGAQICSYARQVIHKDAMTLIQLNYNIFQINCDSIMFSMPTVDKLPFQISNAMLGSFKYVIKEEIVSYYSLGAKSYCLAFKNGQKIENVSKICGLQLNGNGTYPSIDNKLFEFYLQLFFKNKSVKINVPQQRHSRDLKKLKITKKFTNIAFSNQVATRRFVYDSKTYQTFPYGYLND